MPIKFKGIGGILKDWETSPYPGRFYVKGEVTLENIIHKEFILILSREVEEYIMEDDCPVPAQLVGQGYKSWLDSATVQGIIESEFEYSQSTDIQDVIKAIFYYLDNDAFLRE